MDMPKVILFSIGIFSLFACTPPLAENEIKRISSPDGIVDAVVMEVETDATI